MSELSALPTPPLFRTTTSIWTASGRPAGYEALRVRVCRTIKPADYIEQIWTRDVVDVVWEIFRLRRMKAEFMQEALTRDCTGCSIGATSSSPAAARSRRCRG